MPGIRRRAPRRRRTFRRRPRQVRKRYSKVPRILKPKVMRFKRDLEETLLLSNTTPPEGWSLDGNFRVWRSLAWSLGSVGESTDFTNLFRQYRIKGARVRFYFSNSASTTTGGAQNLANSQLLVRMAPNQRGDVETLNNAYWQQVQAKKYKLALNGGRPLDIYMPCKQRNELYASTVGTDYSMQRPKFVSTGSPTVVHYGLNISIERVDGQAFTTGITNSQYCKTITTLYFEMRGVQ